MEAGNSEQKSKGGWQRTGLILALALIPGSAGFLGMGHFYLMRLRRGFILFVIGLPLYALGNKLYAPLAIYLALYLWQAYDAYRISRRPPAVALPGTVEKGSK